MFAQCASCHWAVEILSHGMSFNIIFSVFFGFLVIEHIVTFCAKSNRFCFIVLVSEYSHKRFAAILCSRYMYTHSIFTNEQEKIITDFNFRAIDISDISIISDNLKTFSKQFRVQSSEISMSISNNRVFYTAINFYIVL